MGPHTDSYDVFLLQGAGRRKWILEGEDSPEGPVRFISAEEEAQRLIDDIDVRVLENFEEGPTFVLEPGDMLYLPPRVGHHGISLDKECMTYSIGCRAPSERELVTFFAEAVCRDRIRRDSMFTDEDSSLPSNPGLISQEAMARARLSIKNAIQEGLDDDDFFQNWFGAYVSRSKRDHT